ATSEISTLSLHDALPILEGKVMPRYKVCGGALSARTDRLLEPDYHSVVEETIHRVRFQFAGAEAFEISSPEPMAYMVMRDRFDRSEEHTSELQSRRDLVC